MNKEGEVIKDDLKVYQVRLAQMEELTKDIEEELELKSGENNRLRN